MQDEYPIWTHQYDIPECGDSAMSKQDINSTGWNPPQANMNTYPSVGRFSNDQTASLHTKGSSAKLDRNQSMAPCNNHGQHSQQHTQQPSQRPTTDIVDLRTAPGTEWKVCNFSTLFFYLLLPHPNVGY